MISVPERKNRNVIRALILVSGAFLLMSCIIWDLVGLRISTDVYPATHTAYARWLTQEAEEEEYQNQNNTIWADYNNAEATREMGTFRAILSEIPPTPAPPTITSIDFPPEIPGDGTSVTGTLSFRDPDGDVNRLVIEVVDADNFGGADYDPRQYLASGDFKNGVFTIYNWCEGEQYVVLRYTLYDSAGNKSNSMHINFKCTG